MATAEEGVLVALAVDNTCPTAGNSAAITSNINQRAVRIKGVLMGERIGEGHNAGKRELIEPEKTGKGRVKALTPDERGSSGFQRGIR